MDFFEKISNTLSNTGKEMAKKTKELSSITKINLQISKLEDEIAEKYLEVGKTYFEKYYDCDDIEMKKACDKIKELKDKIQKLEKERLDIKGIVHCSDCNAELTKDSKFCKVCGAKIPETVVEENLEDVKEVVVENVETVKNEIKEEIVQENRTESLKEEVTCPKCHTKVQEEDSFCTECGEKLWNKSI